VDLEHNHQTTYEICSWRAVSCEKCISYEKMSFFKFGFHFIYEFFSEGFSYEVVKFHINLSDVSMHYLAHF